MWNGIRGYPAQSLRSRSHTACRSGPPMPDQIPLRRRPSYRTVKTRSAPPSGCGCPSIRRPRSGRADRARHRFRRVRMPFRHPAAGQFRSHPFLTDCRSAHKAVRTRNCKRICVRKHIARSDRSDHPQSCRGLRPLRFPDHIPVFWYRSNPRLRQSSPQRPNPQGEARCQC